MSAHAICVHCDSDQEYTDHAARLAWVGPRDELALHFFSPPYSSMYRGPEGPRRIITMDPLMSATWLTWLWRNEQRGERDWVWPKTCPSKKMRHFFISLYAEVKRTQASFALAYTDFCLMVCSGAWTTNILWIFKYLRQLSWLVH